MATDDFFTWVLATRPSGDGRWMRLSPGVFPQWMPSDFSPPFVHPRPGGASTVVEPREAPPNPATTTRISQGHRTHARHQQSGATSTRLVDIVAVLLVIVHQVHRVRLGPMTCPRQNGVCPEFRPRLPRRRWRVWCRRRCKASAASRSRGQSQAPGSCGCSDRCQLRRLHRCRSRHHRRGHQFHVMLSRARHDRDLLSKQHDLGSNQHDLG